MSGDEEMYSDSGFIVRLGVREVKNKWPGFLLDPVLERTLCTKSRKTHGWGDFKGELCEEFKNWICWFWGRNSIIE